MSSWIVGHGHVAGVTTLRKHYTAQIQILYSERKLNMQSANTGFKAPKGIEASSYVDMLWIQLFALLFYVFYD